MKLTLDNLRNAKVAILGFGVEGKALSRFLNIEKVHHQIFDEVIDENGVTKIDFASLDDEYDIYFKSPGIKDSKLPKIKKEKISNFTDLFLNIFPGKTIGITGTKGKSTTATLIDAMLKDNLKTSYLIGNIGNYDVDDISKYSKDDYAVMELSSFQLANIKASPKVAIILPIIEDHLDFHKDLREYLDAKSNICRYQKESDWVLVANDEASLKVAESANSKKLIFGKDSTCGFKEDVAECSWGKKNIKFADASQFSQDNLIPNINMEAALAFAFVEGLKFNASMIFEKPSFRIELVGEARGAKFYNDSASTNPVSTLTATNLVKGRKILILGGKSKNLDFSNLFKRLSRDDIDLVIVFGSLGAELEELASQSGIADKTKRFEDLEKVFQHLALADLTNKNVIFSPAAASFDQFKNAKERGRIFNELFNELEDASKV